MPRFIAFHPARFLIVLVMLVLGLLLIFLLFQQTGFPAIEIGCPRDGYSVDIAGVNRALPRSDIKRLSRT
jgi:hypothetical protein